MSKHNDIRQTLIGASLALLASILAYLILMEVL